MQHKQNKVIFFFGLEDINKNCLNEHIIDSQQAIDYWRVRGNKYHENRLGLLVCILKQLTDVSLALPVSYRTQMCINNGLLKPGTMGSLRALFMIYRLKHQIHF